MTTTLRGVLDWSLDRDETGHRDYHVTTFVESDSADDGPQTVMNTADLYQIGDIWNLGNDSDEWAICTPFMRVTPVVTGEPNFWWRVEQLFSTKSQMQRCQDTPIEDPLLEPYGISGSFVKYTKERFLDRNGNILQNTAFQQFRGNLAEFDANRPNVTITMNVPALELDVFSAMVDTVNNVPMWGLSERCVKLSNVSWSRYILGTCDYYYQRSLDFDIDYNTWDRQVLNEATKVLYGHHDETTKAWTLDNISASPPDPLNPDHYIKYKDPNDENASVILDVSTGKPVTKAQILAGDTSVWTLTFQVYSESDFFLLGVPTEF